MRIELSTVLESPPNDIYQELSKSERCLQVSKPLLTFQPLDPEILPETWQPGDYRVRMKLFNVIPFGEHTLRVSIIESNDTPGMERYILQDDGQGVWVSRWDHLAIVRSNRQGVTHYTDHINIEAGILTPVVWLFAGIFYAYRQSRWRQIVRAGL